MCLDQRVFARGRSMPSIGAAQTPPRPISSQAQDLSTPRNAETLAWQGVDRENPNMPNPLLEYLVVKKKRLELQTSLWQLTQRGRVVIVPSMFFLVFDAWQARQSDTPRLQPIFATPGPPGQLARRETGKNDACIVEKGGGPPPQNMQK